MLFTSGELERELLRGSDDADAEIAEREVGEGVAEREADDLDPAPPSAPCAARSLPSRPALSVRYIWSSSELQVCSLSASLVEKQALHLPHFMSPELER